MYNACYILICIITGNLGTYQRAQGDWMIIPFEYQEVNLGFAFST